MTTMIYTEREKEREGEEEEKTFLQQPLLTIQFTSAAGCSRTDGTSIQPQFRRRRNRSRRLPTHLILAH